MKTALIGYGKMGREIERIALERRHTVVSVIDADNQLDFDSKDFLSAEVAIEFSRPDSAVDNYKKCFERNIPVVTGTTGWYNRLDEIKNIVRLEDRTFFYASNFSIGVNIFFAINRYLAKIMNSFPQYDIRMEEIHHVHKLDSPSGTGITLAEEILKNIDRKHSWKDASNGDSSELLITSVREGEVPGIHEIIYESDADLIRIKHDAKNRSGFALGAVLAAEFVKDKKGFYEMQNMLNF
ncbi:MAG: 4-hydroxy-tetrahydrodipicolinate reductase [Dysgonamonadaceae bacterium]|jgi:4-hydroxy-tetrahydrodipicolinate reductase|nr:4-hydroxy-tetrahydrodipicolinate reductase [Dysgonamonadaceae bacterium]